MKKMLQAAVVAAAVLAVPAMSLAAQTKTAGAPPAKSTTHKTESTATHSAHGVVKSMDASSPEESAVTPSSDVCANGTAWSAPEPLTNLIVERESAVADAGAALTAPAIKVANATQAAANPPRTL